MQYAELMHPLVGDLNCMDDGIAGLRLDETDALAKRLPAPAEEEKAGEHAGVVVVQKRRSVMPRHTATCFA